jgi:hypothetical protein
VRSRSFTDIAGLVTGVTAGEDKIFILFAPHAFASQRQYRPSELPSPLVFLLISAHFTATPGIPLASSGL